MLSSSQLQFIEESLNQGKTVTELGVKVWRVDWPSYPNAAKLVTTEGERFISAVRPQDVFIGSKLSELRPR